MLLLILLSFNFNTEAQGLTKFPTDIKSKCNLGSVKGYARPIGS